MNTNLDIMNLKVGGKKQCGIIESVRVERVPDKDGNMLPKILLIVNTETNSFKIDEAWVYNKDNQLKPQGLWVKLDAQQQINAISTLAKVMDYIGVDSVQKLVGKKIELYPKPNGFLALVACEHDQFNE